MTCRHCNSAVKAGLNTVPGITAVQVDLATKDVMVSGTGVDADPVVAAICEAGY